MLTTRRGLITGLASLLAAPAIVRASRLMPVRPLPALDHFEWLEEIYPVSETAWQFASKRLHLGPGGVNFAEPYPDWRFRFENGIAFHEPDPDVVKAA